MLLCDGVCATAFGKCGDHLAIRRHQDHKQHGDGDRHRHGEADPRAAGEGQHQHDGLWTVRHRGHRVERQTRQSGCDGELLLLRFAAGAGGRRYDSTVSEYHCMSHRVSIDTSR